MFLRHKSSRFTFYASRHRKFWDDLNFGTPLDHFYTANGHKVTLTDLKRVRDYLAQRNLTQTGHTGRLSQRANQAGPIPALPAQPAGAGTVHQLGQIRTRSGDDRSRIHLPPSAFKQRLLWGTAANLRAALWTVRHPAPTAVFVCDVVAQRRNAHA